MLYVRRCDLPQLDVPETREQDLVEAMSKSGEVEEGADESMPGSGEGMNKHQSVTSQEESSAAGHEIDATTANEGDIDGKLPIDMWMSHADIGTHAAKALVERWAEDGKVKPAGCIFSQGVFGYSDNEQLNVARQVRVCMRRKG